MFLSKEEHETLLTELLGGEIEQARKTEILQQLRVSHGTAHAEVETVKSTNDKLQKNNDDLIVSNSQLFRQLGVVGEGAEKKEEFKEKEFSETVTLEQLEKGLA